jgi:hypothetical protein
VSARTDVLLANMTLPMAMVGTAARVTTRQKNGAGGRAAAGRAAGGRAAPLLPTARTRTFCDENTPQRVDEGDVDAAQIPAGPRGSDERLHPCLPPSTQTERETRL